MIAQIAAAHGATPAQVALAWLVGQESVSAVPKASSPERRRENLAALELELTAEERAASTRCRRTAARSRRSGRRTGTEGSDPARR